MSTPIAKAPWPIARSAQATVAAAALAEVCRAVTVRAHRLHPQDTSLSASGRASMVSTYVMTVAAVLFLVWFSRCRRNAQLLSPEPLPGSAPWAVASWLVPVVNLWVPRGLVLDLHRASGPGAAEGRDGVLVNVWWAAWVGRAVLVTAGTQLGQGTSLVLLLVAEALNLAAGALAIAVIQRVTAQQAAALTTKLPLPGAADLPHLA
ncbi:DUF4328 domain-containing protein [Streptomyces cellostaticus]|uniref:DUF4328 domain-containing protein n=1 Tax=Streptomyces cellostaticus TaxID=67285 RepID=UPI00082FBFBF|nr:DUF4328 domain-containing protein [Streptomyces cellostaticus]GHI01895.1 hypothetical protein Scel_02160 [Streptomyces cellostaticus]